MRSTGLVLAAGGVAVANEVVFAPVTLSAKDLGKIDTNAFLARFNWRLVPATVVLALTLAGLEKAAPDFAVGLAGLTLLAVLVVPLGNSPTPLENIAKFLGY